MTENTYWLWNGKGIEGPFTQVSLKEQFAAKMILPDAKVMDTKAEQWILFKDTFGLVSSAGISVEKPDEEAVADVTNSPPTATREKSLSGCLQGIGGALGSIVILCMSIAAVGRSFQNLSYDAMWNCFYGFLGICLFLLLWWFIIEKVPLLRATWCVQMGNRNMRRSNNERAVKYYDRALKTIISPSVAYSELHRSALAHHNRGLAKLSLGIKGEAQIDLDQAHILDPAFPAFKQ